jgi:hypothetical protein
MVDFTGTNESAIPSSMRIAEINRLYVRICLSSVVFGFTLQRSCILSGSVVIKISNPFMINICLNEKITIKRRNKMSV